MQRLSLSLAFSIDIMDYDQDCHLNFIAGLEKKIKQKFWSSAKDFFVLQVSQDM